MTLEHQKLIVAIVDQGWSDDILESAREAGATGATILQGRGSGTSTHAQILGMTIEPQKDILLMIVPESRSEDIMEDIVERGDLNKPGTGLVLQLDVDAVRGLQTQS